MNPNSPPPNPNAPAIAAGVFVSTITALKNGSFVNQLDDALRSVTAAVADLKKKGAVVLMLEIEPNGVGPGDVPLFRVRPSVIPKPPKLPEPAQTFFADDYHNLSRRFPGQIDMRLDVVPTDTPIPTKTVADVPVAQAANA